MRASLFRFTLAAVLLSPLCASAQESAATPPAPASVAPANPAIDPKAIEVLRKSFAAQQAMKTFRARMRLTNAPIAGAGDMEMEFVFPDRIRVKMAGAQIVMVGDKAYMQMGEKWMSAPPQFAKAGLNAGDPKKVEEMIANCQSAKHLGVEKVGGVAMETYEFINKTKEGPSKSKFYLTVNDMLPRRVDIEAEVKGQKIQSTLEYLDYGAPITIEAPKG